MKTRILPFALLLLVSSSFTLNAQWTSMGAHVPASGHKVWGLEVVGEDLVWGLTYNYQTFAKPEHSLKSLDGGATWTATPIDIPANLYAFHIFPLDENTAWLATSDEGNPISGKIFKTTDGGETWVEQGTGFTGFNETPAGVYFWNGNEGVAFGATGLADNEDQISVYWTENGGDNWSKVVPPDFPVQLPHEGLWVYCDNGFFDVQGDNVWFVTNGSRIYRSTDRGKTWTAHDTGLTGSNNLTGIAFKDALNGIVVARTPNAAARTTDGGITWETIAIPSTPPAIDIVNVPGTEGTYVLHNATANWVENSSLTLVTYDDGATWGTLSDSPNFDCMEFKSPTLGFAGSNISAATSGIFKWTGNSLRKPIYVNDDAAGANDGSSWADAFADLQDALTAASEGDQIWVAEGTYLPGDDPTATFLMDKNIQLYGGFVGTETTLADRGDPTDHPTILSGDLNGDDVEDDFTNFKSDNVMTVVTVGVNITETALVDGFTISNGQADGTISNQELRGGGLYARGPVILQHCLFTQNFAGVSGGGAHLYAGSLTDGISMEVNNCRFENNRSGQEGGGMYLDAWGQNSTFTVIDCEFNENVAQSFGGGVGAFITQTAGNTNIVVDGCSFTKNSAVEFDGGGMVCSPGGANSNIVLKNSTFTENESALFGTAGIWGWGPVAYGTVDISDCLFENNTATYSAGLSWGSLPNVNDFFTWNMANCDFIGNHATDMGGAMDFYGEAPSEMTVEGCNFIGNSAGLEGGAILAVTNHPEFVGRMSNCVFENNSSPAGAAIVANDFAEEPGMTQDADITFENCLMTGNSGDAGTLNLYHIGTLNLLNCTIADNPAGGIVQTDNSSLTLQNTILHNPDGFAEYTGSTANVTVTSNGGNLVRDTSMNVHLGALDKQETDPGFMPGTFEPSPTSALINAGANDGVTALYDLVGNDRIQQGTVDIGAYESPFLPVSAREVIVGEVGLLPNPATDFLFLQLPEGIIQPLEVSLFDATGRLMGRQVVATGQAIDLQGLAQGMYWAKAVVGERVYTGKFSKF